MKRRQLLAMSVGALTLSIAGKTSAEGKNVVDYDRETYDQALADGKPFMLDFYASW